MRPLLVRARTESGASANETSMRPLLVRRSTDGVVTPDPTMAPFEVWRTTVSAVTRCISIRPFDVERSTGPSTSTRRMAPLSVEPSTLVPGGTLIREDPLHPRPRDGQSNSTTRGSPDPAPCPSPPAVERAATPLAPPVHHAT